ncbi:MAG: glycosyltransferase family 4 protein [Limisphaerales bacterium]
MKILVVTNLYPPHLADTDNYRCQNVTESLRERGHTVRVLTSTHGLASEQRDALTERRLQLNGVFGHPEVTGMADLRKIETHNNAALRDSLAGFSPDLVHVWSMRGLSKSLLLTLRRLNIPTAFDVADSWMSDELRSDPWLAWWHRKHVPLVHRLQRGVVEFLDMRVKWDDATPVFIEPGVRRMPGIFDRDPDDAFKPNSIASFQFRRLYFSSPALKTATEQAGFRVSHGEVIHPGVNTKLFHGEVKRSSEPVKKFLIVTRITPNCGIGTAIEALKLVRAQGAKATLTVYGRGSSEVMAKLRTQAVQGDAAVEFRSGGMQRELPLIYHSHDAFIYPVEREEASVDTPLEAMACGLPVIVNQDHGAENLFRSRESCLSFPSGDPGLLASRMLELIQTPNLADHISQVGQNEVLTRYQFTTTVDQIEQYLDGTVVQWQSS